MYQDSQLRPGTRSILVPLKSQRARSDRERGTRSGCWRITAPLRAARVQQREHLDGFAQPHVVCQTTAQPEALKKLQPAQPFALVIAQDAAKVRCSIGGMDAGES